MQLTEDERRFLAARRWRLQWWRWAGTGLIGLIVAGFVLLAVVYPDLVGVEMLLTGQPPDRARVEVLGIIAPILVQTLFLLLLAFVVLAWAMMHTERRLLALFDRCLAERANPAKD